MNITLVMSCDYRGFTDGAPHNREEVNAYVRGKTVLQGRRTFQQHGLVPNAANLILSRTLPLRDDALVLRSRAELRAIAKAERVWVLGGNSVFKQLYMLADSAILEKWLIDCPGRDGAQFAFETWNVRDAHHHGAYSFYDLRRRCSL